MTGEVFSLRTGNRERRVRRAKRWAATSERWGLIFVVLKRGNLQNQEMEDGRFGWEEKVMTVWRKREKQLFLICITIIDVSGWHGFAGLAALTQTSVVYLWYITIFCRWAEHWIMWGLYFLTAGRCHLFPVLIFTLMNFVQPGVINL